MVHNLQAGQLALVVLDHSTRQEGGGCQALQQLKVLAADLVVVKAVTSASKPPAAYSIST